MQLISWILILAALVVCQIESLTIDAILEIANSELAIGPRGLPVPPENDGSVISELDIREDPSNIVTSRRRRKRGAVIGESLKWRNGEVPYVIDNGLDGLDQQTIRRVVLDWNLYTCLRMTEGRPQTTDNNYINFTRGIRGCYTWLGSQHQSRRVNNINIYSPQCRTTRVLRHLVGHAIGLYHEHSRADRDQYLRVLLQNARSGTNGQFNIRSTNQALDSQVQYDYNSIMHYGKYYFSRPDLVTLETVNRTQQNVIGNADRLSFRDIKTVNLLYNCNANCPPQDCPGEGFVGKDCQCWCPSVTDVYQICPAEEDECGMVFFQNENSMTGTFTTPNYPDNYDNAVECTWEFIPMDGFSVSVRFDTFELEGSSNCGYDYVQVENQRYCNEKPGEIVQSTNLRLLFSSDFSVRRKGFSATYTFMSGEADCGNPGVPLNGNKTGDRYTYQSVLTFACNAGYELVGTRRLTCQVNGEWSDDRPTCRPNNNCGDPGTPANGMKSGSRYTVYSAVSFTCMEGYDISGSSSIICEANGLWSDVTPQCIPSCGRVIYQSPGTGMSGTFTSPGYPSDYGNSRGCNWWFRPNPGFDVSVQFSDFNLEYQENCNYDYVLIKSTRYCGTTRPPTVILSATENILLHSDYSVSTGGFYATYSFVPSSRPPVPTQTPPTQAPPTQAPPTQAPPTQAPSTQAPPTQAPPTQQPQPGPDQNQGCPNPDPDWCGTYLTYCVSDTYVQVQCPAMCNRCSAPNPNPSSSSTTTQPAPTQSPSTTTTTQQPDSGPDPRNPDPDWCSGYITLCGSDPYIQQTCQTTCAGAPPATISCPSVPNPANGVASVTSYDIGSTVEFRCDSGYQLQGPFSRTCGSSGQWSGSMPFCQSVDPQLCPEILDLSNGQVQLPINSNVGSVAEFRCDFGFQLDGLSQITCQPPGRWSGDVPTCQRIPSPTQVPPDAGTTCADNRPDCGEFSDECYLPFVSRECQQTCGTCGGKRRRRSIRHQKAETDLPNS